ncbi:MAG: hypothetical protein RLY35_185, partial [Bacteroidota bacterium]
MKFLQQFFLMGLLAGLPLVSLSQEKFTISGEVRESRTGETMIGAVVFLAGTPYGATTNNFGYYSITAPKGQYTLKVSFVGFQDIIQSIDLNNNMVLPFNLEEYKSRDLVIQADRNRNTESTDMGRIELPVDQIKKLPVVFGEVDILKTIALLPGVQSAGEGNTGFYVRGGG